MGAQLYQEDAKIQGNFFAIIWQIFFWKGLLHYVLK